MYQIVTLDGYFESFSQNRGLKQVMSEYEEKIKKIEEAYGIHMSVERAIDILTIARVQYSSFGALPEAIDTLITAYHEQKQEIKRLECYKRIELKQYEENDHE